jgi:hypothetical protein
MVSIRLTIVPSVFLKKYEYTTEYEVHVVPRVGEDIKFPPNSVKINGETHPFDIYFRITSIEWNVITCDGSCDCEIFLQEKE